MNHPSVIHDWVEVLRKREDIDARMCAFFMREDCPRLAALAADRAGIMAARVDLLLYGKVL